MPVFKDVVYLLSIFLSYPSSRELRAAYIVFHCFTLTSQLPFFLVHFNPTLHLQLSGQWLSLPLLCFILIRALWSRLGWVIGPGGVWRTLRITIDLQITLISFLKKMAALELYGIIFCGIVWNYILPSLILPCPVPIPQISCNFQTGNHIQHASEQSGDVKLCLPGPSSPWQQATGPSYSSHNYLECLFPRGSKQSFHLPLILFCMPLKDEVFVSTNLFWDRGHDLLLFLFVLMVLIVLMGINSSEYSL